MNRFSLAVLVVALSVCGCPRDAAVSTAFDAGAPSFDGSVNDDGFDAGSSLLTFSISAAFSDGGFEPVELNLEPDGFTELDSLKGFTLTSPGLRDYRIRVLELGDQVVPSDDTAAEIDGGLVYSVEFLQPLRPGKTYALTIEAQSGAQFTNAAGRPLDDVRLLLKTRGQVQPEPAAAGAKVSKKKKRR